MPRTTPGKPKASTDSTCGYVNNHRLLQMSDKERFRLDSASAVRWIRARSVESVQACVERSGA